MNQILTLFNKFTFQLFGIAVVLVIIPPIYLIPIAFPLFLSSTLSRIIILLLLMVFLIRLFVHHEKLVINKSLIILIFIFLLSQSVSIFGAESIDEFFSIYKNVAFGIIVFLVTVLLVRKDNIHKLTYIIMFSAAINILYEGILYFFPGFLATFLRPFLYEKYVYMLSFQYQRQRFFGDILVEIFIPLFFYFYSISNKKITKNLSIVSVGLILFFAVVSNWRSKIGLFIFSFVTSAFLNKKKGSMWKLVLPILFFLVGGIIISSSITSYNIVDRLTFSSSSRDIQSLTSRLIYWDEAIQMFQKSPFIGVGLGNYFDHLPKQIQDASRGSYKFLTPEAIVIDNPHNIFFTLLAETGLFGFTSYILLLAYFLKHDYLAIKKSSDNLLKNYIIVFWSLFTYSLANPAAFFGYIFLFWFLRGIIYKLNLSNTVLKKYK